MKTLFYKGIGMKRALIALGIFVASLQLVMAQNAGPDQEICLNTTATMQATGTGTWLAFPSNPASTIIANPSSSVTTVSGFTSNGVYYFTWGATQRDTVIIYVEPQILPLDQIVSNNPNTTLCNGTSVSFTVSAQYAGWSPVFQWYVNDIAVGDSTTAYSSLFTATGDTPTIYKVSADMHTSLTCALASHYQDSVYITVYPAPSAPVLSLEGNCLGSDSIVLSGVTGPGGAGVLDWYKNGVFVDSTSFPVTVFGWGNGNGDSAANQVDGPWGLSADASGNVYVMDAGNFRVQKFPPNSNLATNATTVAGGNGRGTAANQFGYDAYGIWLDASGNLYVSDAFNYRIQKFPAGSTSLTNGTTVAGGVNGNAAPNSIYPDGICLDSAGYLYVADEENNRIQRFPPGSVGGSNAVTVAGTGAFGSAANQLFYPSDVFVDAAGNLYVADNSNHRVQKFPAGSTQGTNAITVAGGNGNGSAANQLGTVRSIFVDASGNLYVGDVTNYRVLKFPPGSTSATNGITVAGGHGYRLAGTGIAINQCQPMAIWVTPNGDLYVGDGLANRVQKWTRSSIDSIYFPAEAGSYYATYVTAEVGCGSPVSNVVTISDCNGKAGPNQTTCLNSTVNMLATGTGTWVALSSNPASTIIADSSSPTTSISGFSALGNYQFSWGSAAGDTVSILVLDSIYEVIEPTVSQFIICSGATDSFGVEESGGGSSPVFQWKVNGVVSGDTSSTFQYAFVNTSDTPQIFDVVVYMQSSLTCAQPFDYQWSDSLIQVRVMPMPAAPVLTSTGNCASTDTLVAHGVPLTDTLLWLIGGSLQARNPAADSMFVPTAPGFFYAMLTDSAGCASARSNFDTVYNCHSNTQGITICSGSADTIQITLPADSFISYQWSPAIGLSSSTILNPVASPAISTLYVLNAIDTNGTTYSDTVFVTVDTICGGFLWPGDANDDGVVNNYDLLPIGLTYGFTGPVREQQDIMWYAHYATSWADTITGGINDVFSDCNGDGTVNINDVNAILQNYNLVHLRGEGSSPFRSGAPRLTMVFEPDTVYNGDTLICHILLGDSTTPAANVYGIAFTFSFNKLIADSIGLAMSFPDSWLASQGNEITLAKNDFDAGSVYAAISRIDHTTASGFGEVARASIVITTDNIDGKDLKYFNAQFQTTSLLAIDQFGDTIPVNGQDTSSTIAFYPTAIINNGTNDINVKLYPNPANNTAQVWVNGAKMSEIVLTDVLGREVAAYNQVNASHLTISTIDLVSGLYFAQIKISNNVIMKQLVVQH